MSAELDARIDAYVDEVWEDVVSDIASLVGHASIADAAKAEPGAPFGPEVRDALDCALGIARRLGYDVSDDDGYVGMADIAGEREEQIATIAHVDVVPAGPGWGTDPFEMVRREGWLLGRGVIDDKGPAVLSLYAGAFLIREGIRPRYTFRALLGCDEEVGMTDVHHYLERHDDPLFLFTPDAEFPVCNAEKGCFGATFLTPAVPGGLIRSWSGAEATNAIPGESVLELALDASVLPAPVANADRIAIESLGEGVSRITAKGIGGGLPRGATLLGARVAGVLQPGDHGSTFGGNPVACAGGVSILSRIDEPLLRGVRERSDYIFRELTGAPGVECVSGMGLMIGVKTARPARECAELALSRGVLVTTAKDRVRLLPALNIPMEQLKTAIQALKTCAEK